MRTLRNMCGLVFFPHIGAGVLAMDTHTFICILYVKKNVLNQVGHSCANKEKSHRLTD